MFATQILRFSLMHDDQHEATRPTISTVGPTPRQSPLPLAQSQIGFFRARSLHDSYIHPKWFPAHVVQDQVFSLVYLLHYKLQYNWKIRMTVLIAKCVHEFYVPQVSEGL